MKSTQIKYLSAIASACGDSNSARVVDIAEKMGYSKASVTRTVDGLVFSGYCFRNADKTISLTTKGQIAVEEFKLLTQYLVKILTDSLNLPLMIAIKEAKEIAYAVSQSTREKLLSNIKNGG